jgi:hypothetical protein
MRTTYRVANLTYERGRKAGGGGRRTLLIFRDEKVRAVMVEAPKPCTTTHEGLGGQTSGRQLGKTEHIDQPQSCFVRGGLAEDVNSMFSGDINRLKQKISLKAQMFSARLDYRVPCQSRDVNTTPLTNGHTYKDIIHADLRTLRPPYLSQ